ncbi:uncharacterized protein K489DRAFT_206031 [Dissoconium aciculare CBS 342.82]|uniref:Uncharacterized protein n=1 Tax=Dissoconium aciculare CBS 342.82 TaxID=1314786 RepID=A0A6J3MAA0_9PEZI|nr:uncharacterized protein K489DRAFT_206031 [Dissoconium aciculare CBS 342.82]KAF1823742.1 hypothetical protein K489DRAFT_206031 [Dissoconium aciculare CBS 342.82]
MEEPARGFRSDLGARRICRRTSSGRSLLRVEFVGHVFGSDSRTTGGRPRSRRAPSIKSIVAERKDWKQLCNSDLQAISTSGRAADGRGGGAFAGLKDAGDGLRGGGLIAVRPLTGGGWCCGGGAESSFECCCCCCCGGGGVASL